jgi:hypothetical protein
MIALFAGAVDRVAFPSQMKAVLTLMFCLMASCAGVGPSSPSLVGEWRYADPIQACRYVFKRDGSFEGDVVYRAKLISRFKGRWSVTGDVLLYKYVSDALHKIPAGTTDRDTLLSVQREFFIIEAADGSKRKYLRVR